MGEIMRGEATQAQIGGVPRGAAGEGRDGRRDRRLRRGDARARPSGPPARDDLVDVVGTGGDGARTFNISTAAAIVAAARAPPWPSTGIEPSSASGSADVLEALGFRLEQPPERIAESIDRLGFGFMFAPSHHPAMRHAAPVRRELGTRTVFNVLGPLTNPAGARAQVHLRRHARTSCDDRRGAGGARRPPGVRRPRRARSRRALPPVAPTSSARSSTARCEADDRPARSRRRPRGPGAERRTRWRTPDPANPGGAAAARDAVLSTPPARSPPPGTPPTSRRARARAGGDRQRPAASGSTSSRDSRERRLMGRFATRSARRAWGRSPRSSAARRRRATCARTPTRRPSPLPTGARARGGVRPRRRALRGNVGRPAGGARSLDRAAARQGLLLDGRRPADGARRRSGRALLLLRDLDDATCAAMRRTAAELGLDTLVEAHDAAELDRAVRLDAAVLGINARDLATFRIDRDAQLELVARAPRDRVVVAESGVTTRAQGAAGPSWPAPTRSSSGRRSCALLTRRPSSASSSPVRSSRSAA